MTELTLEASSASSDSPVAPLLSKAHGQGLRFFIKTYGCQMNVYDSQRIAQSLTAQGYACVDSPQKADVVLVNSCHIREKAAEKIYSDLGTLTRLREDKGDASMIIGVVGCVAQAEGEEILRRAPKVDMVVGPQAYHRLGKHIARVRHQKLRSNSAGMVDTDFSVVEKFIALTKEGSTQKLAKAAPSAFVTVQEGCDKFCSFCVVPYTRGAEYSRPVPQIITEVQSLLARGAREITLLGQNVNAYHGQGPDGQSPNAQSPNGQSPDGQGQNEQQARWSLARLLTALDGLSGIQRLRYTTNHPRDMHQDLIHAHGALKTLMPQVHLPVQSGSDAMLDAMNRRHTVRQYLKIVEDLRTARADIAFSSDFIVGFPGESKEDFAATLRLVEKVDYAQAYAFKYSPRPGTPSAQLEAPQVAEQVKVERLAALQDLLHQQRQRYNASFVGKKIEILLTHKGRVDGQMVGRSPYFHAAHLQVPTHGGQDILAHYAGRTVMMEVESATAYSLQGRLAEDAVAPKAVAL